AGVHVLEDLPGVDEGRQLQLRLHAEEPALVDVGAELDRSDAAVEADETVTVVAAQRAPTTDRAALPERGVARARHVVERRAHGEDRDLLLAAQRHVAARVEPELGVRRRAADRAVGPVEGDAAERALT